MIVKVCGLRDPDNIRAVERLRWTSAASFSIPAPRAACPTTSSMPRPCAAAAGPRSGSSSMLRLPRCSARPNASASGGSNSTATSRPKRAGSFGSAASGSSRRSASRRPATSRRSGPTKTAPTTCCSTPAATATAVRDDASTGRCSTPMRAAFRFCSAAESTRSAPKRSGNSSIPVSRAWISTADSKRPRR